MSRFLYDHSWAMFTSSDDRRTYEKGIAFLELLARYRSLLLQERADFVPPERLRIPGVSFLISFSGSSFVSGLSIDSPVIKWLCSKAPHWVVLAVFDILRPNKPIVCEYHDYYEYDSF